MENEIIEIINNHKSIRKFMNKSIDNEILNKILKSAKHASSHHNIQAYSIIIIRDKNNKEKFSDIAAKQQWIIDCPVFLVICADFYRLKVACDIHNKKLQVDELESIIIGSIDSALVAQNILIAAEYYNMGGVIIGGIRNNTNKVIELLNLPQYTFPLFGICLGYSDKEQIPWLKPRLPDSTVIFDETYKKENILNGLEEYDKTVEDYYTRRTEGKRTEGWTLQMAQYISKARRPELKDKLIKQGFKLE